MQDGRERELTFEPSSTAGAKTLTPHQIEFYNEQGYCHPFKLLDHSQVTATRTYVDGLFEQLLARGEKDNYALLGYHTRCAGLYDLATNTRLLDHVEDIIGPNIICWTSHMFCKAPRDPKSVPFHQDASYWPLTPSRTVSAWLAIDDADRGNSCLQVVPGTHTKGLLKYSKAAGDVVLDQLIDDVADHGSPVHLELTAGQFSLHADLIAHGSDPNLSNRRRCGYVMRFCPPSVKPLQKSWGLNAILCRGEDNTGNWAFNTRPDGDDINDWESYWAHKLRRSRGAKLGKDELGGAVGD